VCTVVLVHGAERLAGREMDFKSVAAGAATSEWAGVVADADSIGGRCCENCQVAAITNDPAATTGVFAYALDSDRGRTLWTVTERLVGERLGSTPDKLSTVRTGSRASE
jgi:hypothetical protein